MLDADVIIRGEKGTFDLAAWMTRHEDEGFEVAAITVAELWHGVNGPVANTEPDASGTFEQFWKSCP